MLPEVRELWRQVATRRVEAPPCETVAGWHPLFRALAERWERPFALALLGGLGADRLAWAFCAGYQAAGRVLVPDLGAERVWALCVTEAEGAHPRQIQTALAADGEGYRLTGEKRWTTLAGEAASFHVLASAGERADGRKDLRVVRVRAGEPGVSLEPMPATPFVPEVAHARVVFREVRVASADVLPGDGYERYVKPFRTVEDIHVQAGLCGYLCGAGARHGWPATLLAELVAVAEALGQLAQGDPSAPEVHVGLAGQLGLIARLGAALDPLWQAADPAEAQRWHRDRALLGTAGRARAQRFEKAWAGLGG